MDILFVTWPGHTYARTALRGVIKWHEAKGHCCRFSNFRVSNQRAHFGSPDLAYIWNGEYPEVRGVVDYLREHAGKIKYMELAWFTQGRFLYFDDMGTNGNCSLFHDSLDWITCEHISAIKTHREEFYQGRYWEPEGDAQVLVPLQINTDTQIVCFGNGWHNQRLIDYAAEKFEKFTIRPHPKDTQFPHYRIPPNALVETSRDKTLIDALTGALKVVGINSTTLLEAALLGAPVECLGKSFLNHPAGREKILGALLARQIPMGKSDLDDWAQPHLGLSYTGLLPRPYWCYPDHPCTEFEDLCQKVRELKPERLLNIGGGTGKMLLQLAEAGLPYIKSVTVVDLPGSVWGEQGSEHHLERVAQHLRSRGLEVELILADSRDAEAKARMASGGPYTFALINGDLTYDGLASDFSTTWELLDSGGVCAFCGIAEDNRKPQRFPDPSGRLKEKDLLVEAPRFWKDIRHIGIWQEILSPKSQDGIGLIHK
jgi:hypothetical protein